jgi:hypothetical protein
MSSYQVDINMVDKKIISAYSKLINSDVVKNIYPMIDNIEIIEFKEHPRFNNAYNMSINIYLNDPTITKNNMYEKNFDPFYLVEKHLKDLSNYLGLEFGKIGFKLYGPDGELLLNWG